MDRHRILRIASITGQIALTIAMVAVLCFYSCLNGFNPHVTIWQQPCFFLSLALFLGIGLGWLISKRVLVPFQWTVLGLFIYLLCFKSAAFDWAMWTPRTTEERVRYEIAGPTLDEKMFDIKASPARLLLVDFWATWCAPCRAQLKHIKHAYSLYHDQGLDIVGVSCDIDKDALSQFVQDNDMPWPQIIFDEQLAGQAWSPLATKCDIHAIPSVLLLDPQSMHVIASTSGAQLDSVVGGILKHLPDKNITPDQAEDNKLVFIPVMPYVTGLLFSLIGALIARRKTRRPSLKLVHSKPA